ncbi:MAG TPA: molybdopterin cofactor-binding domain-containing protein [Vicinamibacterales bacterium]|jgi:xanthine dehydrogenase large subunit|nr:molybdopterin cofactor-binding domain-containing protein [Vicinamibacterales bacterium]
MAIAGKAVPHESARGHVTGSAIYTDDLLSRFPNLLHAWPVTAPHPHARVLALDAAPALDEPGVVTTLTAADTPGDGDTGPSRHDEPLFPTEVMFHRQPVAWVLGETLDAAQRGAARVRVEYEPLPAILTIQEAIDGNSFLTETFRLSRGDMSALDASALRIDGELSIGGQEHFYLETQAAIAWIDETGGVVAQSSTQHPSETQEVIARVLGLTRKDVTVECIRMGGAFGGKEVQANAWAAVAALGAWKTGRPLRVRLTRELDMALTGKRHPYLVRYSAGFSSNGQIEALRIAFFSDGGWSLDLSEPIMWRSLFHCDNSYYLPNVEATGRVCRTHKTSQTAFRGFGGPQAMVAIEDILAQAAQRLSIPADVVRERNFYREGQTTHYGQTVDDAERIDRLWQQLKKTSDFDARRGEIAVFNAQHDEVKRGLAMTPAKFGISFTATFYNQGAALVLIYRDGSVQVNHGGTEMGQGLFTKVRQIAADALGIEAERIRLMATRTDKVPNTSATAASAGTDLNGAAVADACRQLKQRLDAVAASVGRELSFEELCEAAYMQRVPLFAHGFYRTPDIHFDRATGRGKPFHYFAFGAAVCEVEVDRFTGDYRVRRVDILQDVGESLSPVVDRGQVEGGFIQGMGWLTLEELLWDEHGRLATAGASTYKLPSWSEMPEDFRVSFLRDARQERVVFGSKAVGEPPLMLAISVREALRDAVAAFGHGDVVTFDSPATPERIFFSVQRVRLRARRFGGQAALR